MSTLSENMRALREEIERQNVELKRAMQRQDVVRAGQIQYATIPLLEKKLQYLARVH